MWLPKCDLHTGLPVIFVFLIFWISFDWPESRSNPLICIIFKSNWHSFPPIHSTHSFLLRNIPSNSPLPKIPAHFMECLFDCLLWFSICCAMLLCSFMSGWSGTGRACFMTAYAFHTSVCSAFSEIVYPVRHTRPAFFYIAATFPYNISVSRQLFLLPAYRYSRNHSITVFLWVHIEWLFLSIVS